MDNRRSANIAIIFNILSLILLMIEFAVAINSSVTIDDVIFFLNAVLEVLSDMVNEEIISRSLKMANIIAIVVSIMMLGIITVAIVLNVHTVIAIIIFVRIAEGLLVVKAVWSVTQAMIRLWL